MQGSYKEKERKMRVQNISNNNHKQNFGAIVISGPVSTADKCYLAQISRAVGHKFGGGIKEGIGEVVIIGTKHKSKSENIISELIQHALRADNEKVSIETIYKKTADKYTAAFEKKYFEVL